MIMLKRGSLSSIREISKKSIGSVSETLLSTKTGGFAKVHIFDSKQAEKVLAKDSSEAKKRFSREIELIQSLKEETHPNIIKILSVGKDGFSYRMPVYEYNYNEYLGSYPSAWPIAVLEKIFAGLEFLHQKGIIHRDLKPDNILINCGEGEGIEVVIADFGLGKNINKLSTLTQIEELPGSVRYTAPEILLGQSIGDYCSDIYSLGIILRETYETLNKPKDMEIESIIEKATHFSPKQRYQSVEKFREEFFRIEKIIREANSCNVSAMIKHIQSRHIENVEIYKSNKTDTVVDLDNKLIEDYLNDFIVKMAEADEREIERYIRQLLRCWCIFQKYIVPMS